MIKWCIIIISTGIVLVLSICEPNFLAENNFLVKFASEGAVALLAVILTVTLASVANIHLTINRIIAKAYASNPSKGIAAAEPARKEINENAWVLIIVFFLALAAIFIGGVDGIGINLKSIVHGAVVLFLIINVIVLYDIYKATFDLSRAELEIDLSS